MNAGLFISVVITAVSTTLFILFLVDLQNYETKKIIRKEIRERMEKYMGYMNTCPYCGANLDPGEKCECETYVCADQKKDEKEKNKKETETER